MDADQFRSASAAGTSIAHAVRTALQPTYTICECTVSGVRSTSEVLLTVTGCPELQASDIDAIAAALKRIGISEWNWSHRGSSSDMSITVSLPTGSRWRWIVAIVSLVIAALLYTREYHSGSEL